MTRLEKFLLSRRDDTYPEPRSTIMEDITDKAIDTLVPLIPAGGYVLDVGCGRGYAALRFKREGFHVIAITINADDLAVCRGAGIDALDMDQNAMDLRDASYDFIFARHVLEHSVCPLFTITEYFRLLRLGGHCYIELPAPDTWCNHQNNMNHYSVFGASAWFSLIERPGFEIIEARKLMVPLEKGPDTYYAFVCKKPSEIPR